MVVNITTTSGAGFAEKLKICCCVRLRNLRHRLSRKRGLWWVVIHWNSVAGVLHVNSFNNGFGMTTLGARLSSAGSIISLMCAVHCALTPLALLALPLLAVQYGVAFESVMGSVFSPSAEWVFLGCHRGHCRWWRTRDLSCASRSSPGNVDDGRLLDVAVGAFGCGRGFEPGTCRRLDRGFLNRLGWFCEPVFVPVSSLS